MLFSHLEMDGRRFTKQIHIGSVDESLREGRLDKIHEDASKDPEVIYFKYLTQNST